jgi:thymidylate synthase
MDSLLNPHDAEYHRLLQDIMENGEDSMDRTGTGTRSVFGRQMRFDLRKGFPAITTKKLAWKSVVGELLWFLEGSEDNRRLAEITHGDPSKRTIWTPNANELGLPGSENKWLSNPNRKGEDHLGRVYGVQWRRWQRVKLTGATTDHISHADGSITYFKTKVNVKEVDQIARIIDSLRNNPKDRRMILTAFNVGELDEMALPPCHMFAQFHVSKKREWIGEPGIGREEDVERVNCQVYIRSNDMFLGAPFNIASYALLTHMLAMASWKKPGELIITIGDAHIYHDHFDQVKEQLSRSSFKPPSLQLSIGLGIDQYTVSDCCLLEYKCHESIKAKMAV